MMRTCAVLAAVMLMLVAASTVYAGGSLDCGDGHVTWSPDTLSKNDGKLHTITITYTQPCDDSGAPLGCASTGLAAPFAIRVDDITSDEEPPSGKGCKDDPKKPDFTGIGNASAAVGSEPIAVATTAQVRAERCNDGVGRTYTISVTCAEHGETGTQSLQVFVPLK